MGKSDRSKSAQDNRANQLNPTHPAYHRSRGTSQEAAPKQASSSKEVRDNRSKQLNPNNPEYSGPPRDGQGTPAPTPPSDET